MIQHDGDRICTGCIFQIVTLENIQRYIAVCAVEHRIKIKVGSG